MQDVAIIFAGSVSGPVIAVESAMYHRAAVPRVSGILLHMAGTRQEYGCARIGLALDSEPEHSRLHILAGLNVAVRRIEELLKIVLGRSLPFEISDIVVVFGKIIAIGSVRRGYLCPFEETLGRAVKVVNIFIKP